MTTNPKAGDYTIEEGYNFSFTITLAEGYTQSVPVVKANGKTVIPRTNDGKYIVRHIYEDTEITIEGITPDTPTANAEIESGIQVYVRESVLHIRLDNARKAAIEMPEDISSATRNSLPEKTGSKDCLAASTSCGWKEKKRPRLWYAKLIDQSTNKKGNVSKN